MARRKDEARRALVLHELPLVVDLIELTLNHGLFDARASLLDAEGDGRYVLNRIRKGADADYRP